MLVSDAPFETYSSSRVGPAATLGVQLSARWALETGAQVIWRSSSYAAAGYATYAYTVRSTALLVPLLARYTFTAPSSRLRADALGGGYWAHASLRSTETITTNGQSTENTYRNAYNDVGVTLGPQLRYAFGSRVEAKLNLPVNLRVNDYGSFGNRLSLTPQLGVQYVFGQ